MSRFLLLIALAALGGCATTSSDYYRDGRYYGDAGYSDGYYTDDGYYVERYYDGGYAGGDYYYGEYSGRYGYTPDYLLWPTYYSIFWPINHWYVDPYYYPGYYYGVTYFPRDYWSLSLSWGSGYRYGHAYSGYWDYSPYRYSWADNYYDWYPWHHQHSNHRDRHHDRPRYGSARNEAERVMALREHERGQLGSAAYRHSGVRSSSPDRRGPRGAYYPSQQTSAAASANRSARSVSADRNRLARDELVRNAQYRREYSGKPASTRVSDRGADRTWQLERGAGSRAKPAIERSTNRNATNMADSAQDVRQYRRQRPDPEQQAPARVRYSNSVRAAEVQTRQAAPARVPATRSTRSSSTVTAPDRAYRSRPLPAARPSVPASRQSAYRASSRAAVEPRYSAPAVTSRGYSVDTPRYQRPEPAPARANGGGYRAPPAVRSQPSAPASRSSSSSEAKPATESSRRPSGSRVRAARGARSDDD